MILILIKAHNDDPTIFELIYRQARKLQLPILFCFTWQWIERFTIELD